MPSHWERTPKGRDYRFYGSGIMPVETKELIGRVMDLAYEQIVKESENMNTEQPEGTKEQSGQDKVYYCANCGLPMTGEFSTWDTSEGEPVCHMYLRDCIQVLRQQIAALQAQVSKLEDEVAEWQASAMLNGPYGDPEGITPWHNERQVVRLREVCDAADALHEAVTAEYPYLHRLQDTLDSARMADIGTEVYELRLRLASKANRYAATRRVGGGEEGEG